MSTAGGYSTHDRARWWPEPAKRRIRGPFERDRARVLHSYALRRLAAKTQVHGLGASDFPRTRLTHTLECAQIGRELGRSVGCDPDLVEAACLAHDLGHPPFGHNGEAALDAAAQECGGFEGNAQTLRLLTRLEGKVLTEEGSAGLNLTRATLDATVKYPWTRRAGERKFNAYTEDLAVFGWLREGAPDEERCVEAQVMDWADDIAYSVHDVEDGLFAGLVRPEALRDPAERRTVAEVAARDYLQGEAEVSELEEVFAELLGEPFWPRRVEGDLGSLAALKDLTSELIGRFWNAAQEATAEKYGSRPLRRYGAELVVPRHERLECALLKAVATLYVLARDEARRHRAREREIIAELVAAVAAAAPETLEPAFRADYEAAQSDAAALRVVVDQVAALTDTSALAWHQHLTTR